MPIARRVLLSLTLAAIAAAAAGCAGTATSVTAAPAAHTTAASAPRAAKHHQARRHTRARAAATPSGTAAAALEHLVVKGRAPKTGYSRERFGDGWESSIGCDTRDRILRRDLTSKHDLDSCRVASGVLADPYTATRITFVRGASEVDIDHVVALSDAWQKGAWRWSTAEREAFANDPVNLLAVDASTNRAKGDGDAATWLPPNKSFRCAYVARQVTVKTKYHLAVTAAERDAIGRVLARCPGQPLARGGARVHVRTTRTATPTAPPTTTRRHTSRPRTSGGGHVYANCDAARRAGAAPIFRPSPDYTANPGLDRDHDGVACES
jgi:hypothetical protein